MAIKETLEKQLSVLSERSETASNDELCDLTAAMCQVVKELQTIEAREAAAAFASASMERNQERWSERQRQDSMKAVQNRPSDGARLWEWFKNDCFPFWAVFIAGSVVATFGMVVSRMLNK